ncbi:MAG: CvpA family protein [Anaeromyxobacteraceae bacterium]
MALDLVILALLLVAALSGAGSGALRQVIQLVAYVLAALAARILAAPIAAGLENALPAALARAAAPALVFAGAASLLGLLGAAALRGTALSRAVRAPADRALGAVLSGAKALVAAWVALSAIAIAGDALPWIGARASTSEFASLAREHNLVQAVLPEQVRKLEDLTKKLPGKL